MKFRCPNGTFGIDPSQAIKILYLQMLFCKNILKLDHEKITESRKISSKFNKTLI